MQPEHEDRSAEKTLCAQLKFQTTQQAVIMKNLLVMFLGITTILKAKGKQVFHCFVGVPITDLACAMLTVSRLPKTPNHWLKFLLNDASEFMNACMSNIDISPLWCVVICRGQG